VYYSSDAGLSWQQANTGNLRGFRFSSGGDLLYAFMAVGSDSDGLWRSLDQGATWNPVLYTSHLSGIGPDFGGHFALGWSQANENGNFLEFLQPDLQLSPLIHPDLNSPVRQIEIFPLVNTPSFYVINSGGIFYLTGFIVSAPDEDIPSPNVRNPILYPNPANKEIFLKFDPPSAHDLRLSLYDLKGRRIASYAGLSAEAGLLRQSLPELPSGMYLLRVYKDRQIYTRKLLIRN
ncbi:MAG: T9SS type A sorting domain-containing protein, partial [Actinomycetota bacterium]|nr:T9SS type A sorting domain-containing protein [Actinomycetota bacterium]